MESLNFSIYLGVIYKIGTYVTNIKLEKITHEINFDMIVNQTYEIFFPMLVGGLIIAPLVWIITYILFIVLLRLSRKEEIKKIKGYCNEKIC